MIRTVEESNRATLQVDLPLEVAALLFNVAQARNQTVAKYIADLVFADAGDGACKAPDEYIVVDASGGFVSGLFGSLARARLAVALTGFSIQRVRFKNGSVVARETVARAVNSEWRTAEGVVES